ncbi:MAG: GntR family transcriptional regulator [Candidatus Latescibacteria bacterium]|nr:GntR family transcriptional regulator [Candidatus Latescibacterota bacterium]
MPVTQMNPSGSLPSLTNTPGESLANKAYRLIEEMIVTLELSPGSNITEKDLSEKLSIGRTPIREALQRLAIERLVVAVPRHGILVTEINIPEHLALLETRRVLDRLIASRASSRATPEQRETLRDLATKIIDAAAISDAAEFMRVDSEADNIIETASRNIFAVQATAPLHTHCRRFWFMYRKNGDLNQSASLHSALFNGVAKADESVAAAASDALLDYLVQFTRNTLDDY